MLRGMVWRTASIATAFALAAVGCGDDADAVSAPAFSTPMRIVEELEERGLACTDLVDETQSGTWAEPGEGRVDCMLVGNGLERSRVEISVLNDPADDIDPGITGLDRSWSYLEGPNWLVSSKYPEAIAAARDILGGAAHHVGPRD